MLALAASVAGAMTLTILLAIIISTFREWREADPLANIAYGLLAIIGVVLMSLGLAINRRSVSASGLGFTLNATGGDDSTLPTAPVTTTTTTTTAAAPAAAVVVAVPETTHGSNVDSGG